MRTKKNQEPIISTENKLVFYLLSAIIIFSPIPFGSVHSTTFAIWSTLIAAVWIFHKKSALSPGLKPIYTSLAVLLGIGIISAIFHLAFSPNFPVSGVYAFAIQPERFLTFILSLISIGLVIALTSSLGQNDINKLYNVFIISGLIVSTIALMHWLSDNGRLFWIFEPTYVFETNRARWPFVNSNHLGAFLIIPFFICLYRLITNVKIANRAFTASRFSSYISGVARVLKIKNLPITVAYGVALIWIGIAITATLSRAVVSSVVVLSIITIVMDASNQNQRSKNLIYWGFGLIIFIGALILVDQSELIESRLYYSLMASKDDLRWQMYKESLQLISLLGVGFGGWERSFFKIASPTFVGLNPEYLHSDILQFIVEAGLISIFIIAFQLKNLIIELFSALMKKTSKYYAAGIIGVFMSACFDFPFRMPSILWTFSIFLVVWIINSSKVEA